LDYHGCRRALAGEKKTALALEFGISRQTLYAALDANLESYLATVAASKLAEVERIKANVERAKETGDWVASMKAPNSAS
jgi:hypothetical protein